MRGEQKGLQIGRSLVHHVRNVGFTLRNGKQVKDIEEKFVLIV